MGARAGWEHRYVLSYQATSIVTSVSAANSVYTNASLSLFSLTGKCGIILDNKPTIDPGVEHINTPKANGISQEYNADGRDYVVGKKMPTVQLVMGLNKYNLAVLGGYFVRKGQLKAVPQHIQRLVFRRLLEILGKKFGVILVWQQELERLQTVIQ